MRIRNLLESSINEALHPKVFELDNESHGHNVPQGSETHFRVIIVSDAFNRLSRVKRHQLVYKACEDALRQGLHALAMQCFTEDEWASGPEVWSAPPCKGGMKKDSR